jgi:FAD/FMN-containing dehydrogenase
VNSELAAAVGELATRVAGPVLTAGDEGFDSERVGYQTHAPHVPVVVVGATNPDDVREAVVFGARHGLPVGVQSTGHCPARPDEHGVLISTRRMTDVQIDPQARTARFAAGVRWEKVIEAAAPHGLAPLSGSAPHVGAVAYTLGGGLGLMSRRYGYAVDHVRAIDVVTADGQLRHVTADSEPDLFWALRGGRDNFGIVTALEVELFPVSGLYGGGLYFPGERAEEVLNAYLAWTRNVPEEMTSSISLVPFPNIPMLPEPIRGQYAAHIRLAYLGDADTGAALIAPLREIGPRLIDSIQQLPYTASGSIHNDPPNPAPFITSNVLLDDLDKTTIREVIDLVGINAAVTCVVEVRHLGGALSRPPAVANAIGLRSAPYSLGVLSKLNPGDDLDIISETHDRLLDTLAPKTVGRHLNFLYGHRTTDEQIRSVYQPSDYQRLQELKAVYDPTNLFRINHNIPPIQKR